MASIASALVEQSCALIRSRILDWMTRVSAIVSSPYGDEDWVSDLGGISQGTGHHGQERRRESTRKSPRGAASTHQKNDRQGRQTQDQDQAGTGQTRERKGLLRGA